MTTPPADHSVAIWERHWQAGVLHSCGRGFSGNYGDAIARFWNERYSRLPDGAVVVDIGTGNGALPLLAKDAAQAAGRHWQLHGVDFARIDPARAVKGGARRFAGIRFHPRTPIERLPFADGSVDLLTSQYGFEYAERDAATAEVLRVTGPDGVVAMVLHSRGSIIARTSAEQLGHCEALFGELRLFDHARRMAAILAAAPGAEQRRALAADPEAEATRRALNDAAASAVDLIRRANVGELLQRAVSAVRDAMLELPTVGGRATLARLERDEDALRDEWGRLKAFDSVALDAEAFDALQARFRAAGRTVAAGPFRVSVGALMGWWLVAGEPDG